MREEARANAADGTRRSVGVQATMLVCRVGRRLCGIPLEHVGETMRPLPIEPLAGLPGLLLGVSLVRGRPVPVVDARSLLGVDRSEPPTRFVTLRLGSRSAMLAVDSVVGVRAIDDGTVEPLPPLLGALAGDTLSSLGSMDDQLLLVFRSARLVPDHVWLALDTRP